MLRKIHLHESKWVCAFTVGKPLLLQSVSTSNFKEMGENLGKKIRQQSGVTFFKFWFKRATELLMYKVMLPLHINKVHLRFTRLEEVLVSASFCIFFNVDCYFTIVKCTVHLSCLFNDFSVRLILLVVFNVLTARAFFKFSRCIESQTRKA